MTRSGTAVGVGVGVIVGVGVCDGVGVWVDVGDGNGIDVAGLVVSGTGVFNAGVGVVLDCVSACTQPTINNTKSKPKMFLQRSIARSLAVFRRVDPLRQQSLERNDKILIAQQISGFFGVNFRGLLGIVEKYAFFCVAFETTGACASEFRHMAFNAWR